MISLPQDADRLSEARGGEWSGAYLNLCVRQVEMRKSYPPRVIALIRLDDGESHSKRFPHECVVFSRVVIVRDMAHALNHPLRATVFVIKVVANR